MPFIIRIPKKDESAFQRYMNVHNIVNASLVFQTLLTEVETLKTENRELKEKVTRINPFRNAITKDKWVRCPKTYDDTNLKDLPCVRALITNPSFQCDNIKCFQTIKTLMP